MKKCWHQDKPCKNKTPGEDKRCELTDGKYRQPCEYDVKAHPEYDNSIQGMRAAIESAKILMMYKNVEKFEGRQ
jgi:hypothetical protein